MGFRQQSQLKKVIMQSIIGFLACFIISAFFVTKKISSAFINEVVPTTAERKTNIPIAYIDVFGTRNTIISSNLYTVNHLSS